MNKEKINLYFIRHAEPDLSVKDDLTRPLTGNGLSAARMLVPLFDGIRINAIYSSPFKRAVDTITPLAEGSKVTVTLREDLRERQIGRWLEDFSAYSSRQWQDFSYKEPGGESLEEVQKRNIKEIKKILASEDGNIFIGTHGTALCTIIHFYEPGFKYEDFRKMVNRFPWIIKMEFQGGNYRGYEEIPFRL